MLGFFIILALPLLNIPPWFTPASYTQAIVFRSLLAILAFIYLVKNGINFQKIKETLNPRLDSARQARSKIFLPLVFLLAYFFTVFISTLFSLDVSNSLWGTPQRGAGFVNFAFLVIFCLMSFAVIKDRDWKKLLDFSLIIGFLVGSVAIFQQFGIFRSVFAFMPIRPSSTLGNPIILALYLLPLLFFSLSSSILEKDKIRKYFYIILTIFYSFVIIFITQTRAAILGVAVGLFWFLIAYPIRDHVISNGASPLPTGRQAKKWKVLKISTVVLSIIFAASAFFLSANPNVYEKWPSFIKDPTIRVVSLSKGFSSDPARISAWKISISAFFEKPYFGYGPENFYIAFNKYYDPNLPMMEDIKDFDRAHNYLIQTLVDSGIFALIFYLAFFSFLIWKLQKIKRQYPVANGLQAGFLALFVASLASIDGVAIMLIFFFFTAYSFHLISPGVSDIPENIKNSENKLKFIKIPTLIILFLVLIVFLWQYNFVPLQMNKQLVIAQSFPIEDWKDASKILEEQSKINTFFLPYTNSIYLNLLVDVIIRYPEENITLSEKAAEISEKNAGLQPYNYRNWLRMGESLATIAKENKDLEIIKKADDAFNKALELNPKDPSILSSYFMANISLGDLKGAKEKSDFCLKTFPKIRGCLWISGLINIYLGDIKTGKEFIEKAREGGDYFENEISLRQLVAAYLETKNYKEMLPLYQKLATINSSQVQYKTSIMLCYKELGNYQMVRQLATDIIKTNPEIKDQIEQFLRGL